MSKRTALIDADVFAFKAASACEKAIEWEPGNWTYHASEEETWDTCVRLIEQAADAVDAERIVIAMSDPLRVYWRHDLWPEYKAGRTAGKRPLLLMWCKEKLGEEYESFVRPQLEADDILGILSTNPKLIKGEKVIVSVDKDMLTVPGLFYHYDRDELIEVSESEADYHHMYQTLVGDTTDGYPGCPGVGPKSVAKILKAGYQWKDVVAAFEKRGLTEDDALIQARVARILRHGDYNYKHKHVVLWKPKENTP